MKEEVYFSDEALSDFSFSYKKQGKLSYSAWKQLFFEEFIKLFFNIYVNSFLIIPKTS